MSTSVLKLCYDEDQLYAEALGSIYVNAYSGDNTGLCHLSYPIITTEGHSLYCFLFILALCKQPW